MEPFHSSIDTELKLKSKSVVMNFKGTCLYSYVGPSRQRARCEFGILSGYSERHSGAWPRPTEWVGAEQQMK